jgi:hypothetical protein
MKQLKMTTMKKYTLVVLNLLCSLILFADDKLAIINDSDGYTFVRCGQGTEFKVSDTLFTEDFFYFDYIVNSDWAKISAWKGRQIEGYIHRSRIQEVEKLDHKKQKELITKTLERHRVLADNFQHEVKFKNTIDYKNSIQEKVFHTDTKYDPILTIIPKYFCSTSDVEILQLFFATIWADFGSANEMPSFSIGDCFICKPDLVIKELTKIKNVEQKKNIIDHIEWGLLNAFDVDENGKSKDKEYNRLRQLLDKER